MIDTVAERGWLTSTLRIMQLFQMIIQARWHDESALTTLPYIQKEDLQLFSSLSLALPMLCDITYDDYDRLENILRRNYRQTQIYEVIVITKKFHIYYLNC